MRLGVLGGTFDPPHEGHLALARAARATLELQEVIFVPAARNPLKSAEQSASGADRLAMVRLAIEGEDGLSASDIEISRGRASYTVETMTELMLVRRAEYWFLIGADALARFTQWHRPEALLRLCRLGVARRGSGRLSVPAWVADKVDWIQMSPISASATQIRRSIAEAKPATRWLKPAVMEYIESKGLYKKP